MAERLRHRWRELLGPSGDDFRTQLVSVAAVVGIPVSWLSALINVILGAPVETVLVNVVAGFAILALFGFARRTGRYRLTYLIAVVGLFLVVFPWLFFTGGGVDGGMPVFFMFAIAFTAILLEGVALWVMVPAEMVVFAACLYVGYRYPESVIPFDSGLGQVMDTSFAVLASGIAMVVSVRMLVGMYERNWAQLQQRNAELARLDQARAEFLGMVAHELNTPLTVIQAHAEEVRNDLADRTVPTQALTNLDIIEGEASRSGRLVSQLLDLARINSGSLALQRAEYKLDTIVQQTLQIYRPVWSQFGNTVEVGRSGASPTVVVDRERVVQVLVNLLSNAARHSRDGTITVSVAEANGFAELSVSDDGEGIAPQVLGQLGTHPMRGRTGGVRSARDAGLGVGLVISRSIMDAHGGDLTITSELGVGTTVTCRFPLIFEPSV